MKVTLTKKERVGLSYVSLAIKSILIGFIWAGVFLILGLIYTELYPSDLLGLIILVVWFMPYSFAGMAIYLGLKNYKFVKDEQT